MFKLLLYTRRGWGSALVEAQLAWYGERLMTAVSHQPRAGPE
jgi:hypothetical protein